MRSALLSTVSLRAFSSEMCETVIVKIKGSTDPVRVNKSDFDADQDGDKTMTLASKTAQADDVRPAEAMVGSPVEYIPGTPLPPAPSAPNFPDAVAPSTPSADTMVVQKEGTKAKPRFFVVDPKGVHITDKLDIAADGYDDEVKAWAAIERVKKQPFEQGNDLPPATPDAQPATADSGGGPTTPPPTNPK